MFVLFPEKYRLEESLIREALPVLGHRQVKIIWDDAFRKKLGEELVSYLYHVDPQGAVVVKAPLKGLPAEAFVPFALPLKKISFAPKKTNLVSGNTDHSETKENYTGTDTLYSKGSFPLKPTDFDLSESYIAVADRLTNGMFYYNRKIKRDSVSWTLLQAKMLRPATYRKYFDLKDTSNIKTLEDSLDRELAATGFASNGSVTSLTVQGYSIYFFTKYLYLRGGGVYPIAALYELRDGKVYGPVFENAPLKRETDSLMDAIFKEESVRKFATENERENWERAAGQKYDNIFALLKNRSPFKFSMIETGPVYLGKNLFASLVQPLDSQNYRLLSYYHRDDSSLTPVSSAPFIKPAIWRENNLGNNFNSITGHYPYVMTLIANDVYDLKNQKTYSLPIPLGDYDYSPEAMRTFKPRMGLFIHDVVGDDQQLKVLYNVNSKEDSKQRMYLLDYDLVTQRVLSQKEFLPSGKPFDPDALYRFDGLSKVVSLNQSCRCIIFYPAR